MEIGCASGYGAINYCKYANSYTGIDTSNVAIDNCNALLIKNTKFYCADGHKLPENDKSIDFVFVNGLLHYLDLEASLKEISRVLSDSGFLIFSEPLGTNPAFNLYRIMTPNERTMDERPFTFNDLAFMRKYFDLDQRIQRFGFFSILSAFLKNDNIRTLLTITDKLLSKTLIKYIYWQFSGIAKKRLR